MAHRTASLALLPLTFLACADRPATAVVTAVAADSVVLHQISHVRVSAQRGGTEKWSETYEDAHFASPGTLLFHDTSHGEDKAPLRVLVEGFDGEPRPGVAPKIQRSARLTFVPEKTKLLRLGLAKECIGVSCDPGSTCYRGACQSEVIEDPSALEDAPEGDGPIAAPDPTSFDDLAEGGAGGAGGEAGAGGNQGGEAGAAGGESKDCEGPLGVNLGVEAPDGSPLGIVAIGETLVLRAKVQGSPVGSFQYTYRVFSRSDAAGTTLKSSSPDDVLSVEANRCLDVRYEVVVSDSGCTQRTASAQVNVPSVVASGPYVGQEICTGQLPPGQQEECGSVDRPWCGIAEALASVDRDALRWKGPSGRAVVKLVGGAKPYLGPLVMVDGVDVEGGWLPDFSARSGLPTRIEGAALPMAGETGRCLVRWPQNGDVVRATLSNVHLSVGLPAPNFVAKEVAAAVCIGSRSDNEATLTRVKIDGTPGDHGLYFEGVYVHDNGKAKILIEQADILTPSLSPGVAGLPQANNAVKVDGPSSAEVEIRGGIFRSGGIPKGGNFAGGLLWLGDGALTIRKDEPGERARFFGGPTFGGQSFGIAIHGPVLLDLAGLYAQGDFASLDNERSVGLWLEGTSPQPVLIDEAELVGGAMVSTPFDAKQLVPVSAGLFRGNLAERASVALRNSSLVGGGWGSTRLGLLGLNLEGTLENLQVIGAPAEDSAPCMAGIGVYLQSTLSGISEMKVKGGSFLGGRICSYRAGMRLERMRLLVEPGSSPSFVGTDTTKDIIPCGDAYGLIVEDPGSTVDLSGGYFAGGTRCTRRTGLHANNAWVKATGITAIGATSTHASNATGVFLGGQSAKVDPVEVSKSTLVGGSVDSQNAAPGSAFAVGLRLELNQGGTFLDNTIRGCPAAPNNGATCTGAILAAGVLMTRTTPLKVPNKIQVSQGEIVGGPIAGNGDSESIGVLIQSTSGVTSTANVEFVDVSRIEGNEDPNLRPTQATGVRTELGGVTLRSGDLKGVRQRISGGLAAGNKPKATGVILCGNQGNTNCKGIEVRGNVIQGGPLKEANGKVWGLVASHGEQITVDANFIQSGGLAGIAETGGVRLGWIPGGLITNNFFFGAEGAVDHGCAFIPESFGTSGELIFYHNFCLGLGAPAGKAYGLLADVTTPTQATYDISYSLFGAIGSPDIQRTILDVQSNNTTFLHDHVALLALPASASGSVLAKIKNQIYTTEVALVQSGELPTLKILPVAQSFPPVQPGVLSPDLWRPNNVQCSLLLPSGGFSGILTDYDGSNRSKSTIGPIHCP